MKMKLAYQSIGTQLHQADAHGSYWSFGNPIARYSLHGAQGPGLASVEPNIVIALSVVGNLRVIAGDLTSDSVHKFLSVCQKTN